MTEMLATCRLCIDKQEPHDWHDDEIYLSEACKSPTAQQAEILPCDQEHRHPVEGPRPQWSGYCISARCECTCHQADDITIDDFELEETVDAS
jgi:hypothetical protein